VNEDLADLPIAQADQVARERIEQHRDEMGRWRRARAERVAQERQTRPVVDIAAEMGVHPQVVYELLREARNSIEG